MKTQVLYAYSTQLTSGYVHKGCMEYKQIMQLDMSLTPKFNYVYTNNLKKTT